MARRFFFRAAIAFGAAALVLAVGLGWKALSDQNTQTRAELRQLTGVVNELQNALQAEAQRATQAVGVVRSELGATGTRLDVLVPIVAALQGDLKAAQTALQADIRSTRDVLRTTASDLSALSTQAATTGQEVSGLRVDLTATTSKLDVATGELSAVKGQVGTTGQEVATLRTDLGVATTRLSQTATKLDETVTKLDGAATRTLALEEGVSKLQAADTTQGARVNGLDQNITRLLTSVTRLQENVATLTRQVAGVQASQGASSASSTVTVSGSVSLQLTPGSPLAGQDVQFSLEGLQPWQRVSVSLLGPDGAPVEWITEEEGRFAPVNGRPVTDVTRYGDAAGRLGWVRIGTQDGEGTWRTRISLEGTPHTVSYQVSQLQLNTANVQRFGLELRRYQGLASDLYYSSGVPAALVLDLQAHLHTLRTFLKARFGLESRVIPDLYLFGSLRLFETAGTAIGHTVTREAGFYSPRRPYPGIYMRADDLISSLKETLTHEYVHQLLDEQSPNVALPAWFNEGTATYYEHVVGLASERPNPSRSRVYGHANRVQEALRANRLPSLPSLEDQATWNAQRDPAQASLNYSTGYMAIRFFVERFQESALRALVDRLANNVPLAQAIQETTEMRYPDFEQAFRTWLATWRDPEREAVRQYHQAASQIMNEEALLSQQRNNALAAPSLAAWDLLVASAAALERRASQLSALTGHAELQGQLRTYLGRLVAWLQLEQELRRTGDDTKRVQANGMLPEINARSSNVGQRLNDLAFVYRLR